MNTLKLSLGLTTAIISLTAAPAFAQTAADTTAVTQTESCVDANANKVCDSEESAGIVVTGSRIKHDNFNSASPVEVFTRDDATVAGFDSSTAILQSTAVTAGARQIDNTFGGFLVDGGAGANTLSLRSLGAARTLVLLNGRRLAPSGTSGSLLSSDLNVLPSAIVARIEVLKDGASSIYGSDAIAGVVNVITDKKVSGLTIDAGVSVPEVGQGVVRRVALVGGYKGERLNIAGSIEVYDRTNLSYGAHDYLKCQVPYTRTGPGAPFGSGDFISPVTGQPKCYPTGFTGVDGVTVNTIGTSIRAGAAGGPGTVPGSNFNRFRVNPAAGGSVPGFEGVNGGDFNGLGNRDTTNGRFFDKSLISPTTNYTGYLQASYDLHALGNAQLYGDGLFARRDSSQRGFFQLILDYPVGSPLIPTALQFSNQAPGDQLGRTTRVGVRVFTSRNYTSSQRVDYMRFGGGLRGSLPFSDWTYDLYVGHSYNDGRYTLRQPITSRLAQAQNVVASGSGFACADPSNGCVAAPAITGALINGDVPQAYLDFIAAPVSGKTKFFETTFAANLAGTLFELPAGKVGLALGAEYRKQRIDDEPAIEQQTGQLYSFSTAGVTKGKDAVREVFGELEVPLLRNRPFFYDLTLSGSLRYTDYNSYGSGWTYKVGGVFAPIKEISFRGTYGTSFRAPGLSEQFKAPTSGFLSNTVDPCNNYGIAVPTSTIYKNCLAAGVPTNYGSGAVGAPLGQNVQVNTTGGSVTGLAAETSRNWTVGTVIQPPLGSFGKLELAVDYFNIDVKNGVGLFGGGQILQSCYNDVGFTTGTNGGELCQFITRLPATSTSPYRAVVTNGYVNIARDKVRGLDFDLRFTTVVGPGSLRLNAGATRYFEQSNQLSPTNPLTDHSGEIYQPKWTGNLDVDYKVGQISFYYGLNWVGKMDSYKAVGEDPATSIYQFRTPDYFTHNASITWSLENFRLTLGVKNFTDKEPPLISAFAYNRLGNSPLYSGFDHVGRTFFLNVTATVK